MLRMEFDRCRWRRGPAGDGGRGRRAVPRAPRPATRRRAQRPGAATKESFGVIPDDTAFAAEGGGAMTATTGRKKMLTQFRTLLVPALALAALASMTGSAYADHETLHTMENLKGGLKALVFRQ